MIAVLGQVVRRPVPATADPHGIHRVLLAFDGSPAACEALKRAIEIAVRERALLTIAGVVAEPAAWVGCGPVAMPLSREVLQRDLERDMQRQLAAARDEVPATVSVTTRILRGRPTRALAALAEEGAFDLVIAAQPPAGRLRRLLGATPGQRLRTRCHHASVLAVPGA